MYMAEGLDTGDILLKRELTLGRRETGGSLHDRLGLLAPDALAEALAMLVKGNAPRIPQDDTQASHTGKLTREHGLLSWESSLVVDRRVRAMNPWPGAYTVLPAISGHPERKLKVYSVIQSKTASAGAIGGTVLAAEARGLLVAAGDRSVWLTEVQLEGKRRMRTSEFLRGTPVPLGIRLGAHTLP
jgi:methionyl-tRNA formyltransferase